ncbi:TRAP transporter small permease [Hydrogenophaga sp.]|uniref:TRAP transporter small permease n=1 Tax=Hydrogenophaga sp. TaxID=1904254 RepID=UPI0027282BE3|nr:TRAP transporter small permease [Hydrogenophaga sp.]MDO9437764.1 TRAP transporter small permease [Hydrogenophaga sp.]
MSQFVFRVYQGLLFLSCISMVSAFACVLLGVIARELQWDIPGLDAYAGYAIACALFFALPATLRQGEHIRVTLLLDRLPARLRVVLEWLSLVLGFLIATTLAWYAVRLVWMSWVMHDISPGADASPLWIPQLGMAMGCAGFALSFAHALQMRWQGGHFVAVVAEAARTE